MTFSWNVFLDFKIGNFCGDSEHVRADCQDPQLIALPESIHELSLVSTSYFGSLERGVDFKRNFKTISLIPEINNCDLFCFVFVLSFFCFSLGGGGGGAGVRV